MGNDAKPKRISAPASLSEARETLRRSALDFAAVCLVAASQFGMLLVAQIYLRSGRATISPSPEALIGSVALVSALAVARVAPLRLRLDIVSVWLLSFISVGCVGELLRPDLRLGEVSSLLSIAGYYLAGRAIGGEIAKRDFAVTIAPGLLAIYTVWYLAMVAMFISGDLGFYGYLQGSGLGRLEFRDGFTSTEIPMYVGLQLPVLLFVAMTSRGAGMRAWALVLTTCALLFVVASLSVAALISAIVVIAILFMGHRGRGGVLNLRVVCLVAVSIVLVALMGQELVESVRYKALEFALGERGRALLYAQVIDVIREQPFGIGKGRFIETSYFDVLGRGEAPHHNLLGIGAELGLPALFVFIAFVLVSLVYLWRGAFGSDPHQSRACRLLVSLALAAFVFQQLRGLLQDTWTIRETYLWLGVGVGALFTDRELRHRSAGATSVGRAGAAEVRRRDDSVGAVSDGST